MRTLVIADIHANLPALEAVLQTPQARACDRVVSLGDQINFGPQPREVMQRLTDLGAVMLLGNHEERFRHIGEAEFAGYNWQLLRWTWARVKDFSFELPVDVRLGSVLCTHGLPGDPYHLVHPEDLPAVLDALPEGTTHLLSGHSHMRWMVTHGGKTAVNPGSLGVPEHGRGQAAPFAVLEMEDGRVSVTLHEAPYDVGQVVRAYVASGAAEQAPEMTRGVLHSMLTGEGEYVFRLVRHVADTARAMHTSMADPAAWAAADKTWRWREPMTSREYWRMQARALG